MSFNYHQDHLAQIWRLADHSGQLAQSCCVAFGMERLAVALFDVHGTRLTDWPADVRRALNV